MATPWFPQEPVSTAPSFSDKPPELNDRGLVHGDWSFSAEWDGFRLEII
jgi:hypothetical protein